METIIDRRHALARLAAAGVAGAGLLAVPKIAKAAVPAALSLAEEFEAAWRRENAAFDASDDADDDDPDSEISRASEATRKIVDRIIAAPTRNLDDCKLKARAFLWCYSGDVDEGLGVLSDRAKTTDLKIIHALVRDLLAIGRA